MTKQFMNLKILKLVLLSEKILCMKKLTLVLILVFSINSLTRADDISEFEIEGISIGDSLLNYMSRNEIKKAEENISEYPNSNYIVIFYNNKSQIYDEVEIVYNRKDTLYTIQSIAGLVEEANNYQKCKIKKKEIVDEFKITFKNSEIYEDESDHEFASGSLVDLTDFYPKSGGFARISCTDWAKKYEKEHLWVDSLKISLGSKEFLDYLSNQ